MGSPWSSILPSHTPEVVEKAKMVQSCAADPRKVTCCLGPGQLCSHPNTQDPGPLLVRPVGVGDGAPHWLPSYPACCVPRIPQEALYPNVSNTRWRLRVLRKPFSSLHFLIFFFFSDSFPPSRPSCLGTWERRGGDLLLPQVITNQRGRPGHKPEAGAGGLSSFAPG